MDSFYYRWSSYQTKQGSGGKQWVGRDWSDGSFVRDNQQHSGRSNRNSYDYNNMQKGKYEKKPFDEQSRQSFDQRRPFDETRKPFDDNRRPFDGRNYDYGRGNYQDQPRRHFDDQENYSGENQWKQHSGGYDGRRPFDQQRGYQEKYDDQRSRGYNNQQRGGGAAREIREQPHDEGSKAAQSNSPPDRRYPQRQFEEKRPLLDERQRPVSEDDRSRRPFDEHSRNYNDRHYMNEFKEESHGRHYDEQPKGSFDAHDDNKRGLDRKRDGQHAIRTTPDSSRGYNDNQPLMKDERSFDRQSKESSYESDKSLSSDANFCVEKISNWNNPEEKVKRGSEEMNTLLKHELESSSWADVSLDCEYSSDSGFQSGKSKHHLLSKEDSLSEKEQTASEPRSIEKSMPVVPTPITKEKLEACDKTKEIRKNMTTLKKGSILESGDKQESKSALSSKENQQHQKSREKGNVWNNSGGSGSNNRSSKNGESTRSDNSNNNINKSQGGGDTASSAMSSWAEKTAGMSNNNNSTEQPQKSNKQTNKGGQGNNNKNHQNSNHQTNSNKQPTTLINNKKENNTITNNSTHKWVSPLLETPISGSNAIPTVTTTNRELLNTNAQQKTMGSSSNNNNNNNSFAKGSIKEMSPEETQPSTVSSSSNSVGEQEFSTTAADEAPENPLDNLDSNANVGRVGGGRGRSRGRGGRDGGRGDSRSGYQSGGRGARGSSVSQVLFFFFLNQYLKYICFNWYIHFEPVLFLIAATDFPFGNRSRNMNIRTRAVIKIIFFL